MTVLKMIMIINYLINYLTRGFIARVASGSPADPQKSFGTNAGRQNYADD